MNTVKFDKKNVRVVGHRGISGLEKENTLPSFIAAGNRSYFGIETDVHRTADGTFVVVHDNDLRRIASLDIPIETTPGDVLRRIPLPDIDGTVGRPDLRIPTLAEYIRVCKRYEKTAVLELKNQLTPEEVSQIIEIIRGEEYLTQTVFISFWFDNLVYVRDILPEQTVQFLYDKFTEDVFERVAEHRFDVDAHYQSLSEKLVARYHALGLKVNAWTCDNREDAERLVGMGVDFITTNILE